MREDRLASSGSSERRCGTNCTSLLPGSGRPAARRLGDGLFNFRGCFRRLLS